MNCKSCKKEIPQGRVDLGYKVCVDCSDVERYGCVDIVYHKTGNTIQIMPREEADQINKLAQRTGFGTLRALRSGKSTAQKPKIGKGCSKAFIGSEHSFKEVGEKCMMWADIEDWEMVTKTLQKAKDSFEISTGQYNRLLRIFKELMPKEEKVINTIETKVDEEIEKSFRHWRNSKVYR
tara:strand:- start:21071 stop:21607 length:537 start_codon:yes stop_codon:yes gene_type:complete